MKQRGGDLPRIHSECLQKIGIQGDRDYSQLVIMVRSILPFHSKFTRPQAKGPSTCKHNRRWSFRQGPTLIRRYNDHKANTRNALAPGRCLVGATVRLPAEVSFFLFLEVGEGWRKN